ncbi:cysteine-rich CWC family protein [Rummeliibacillus sp. JY-2-4R]
MTQKTEKGLLNLQIDEKYCPICGEENHCMAGTSEQDHCWCKNVKISKEVLKLVPVEMKGKYCICQNCSTK